METSSPLCEAGQQVQKGSHAKVLKARPCPPARRLRCREPRGSRDLQAVRFVRCGLVRKQLGALLPFVHLLPERTP